MEDVEVRLRREAARRRLAGESPAVIATDLGRTRQWVAKWELEKLGASAANNLLVCDEHGELITRTHLTSRARQTPPDAHAARPPLRLALRARLHASRATPPPGNDPLAATRHGETETIRWRP